MICFEIMETDSVTPSSSRSFHWDPLLLKNKNIPVPHREQGQEILHPAVPPWLPNHRPLITVPTHRLPGNGGNSSEDTKATAGSLCPRRSICCSAFHPTLSTGGSLWMRWQRYLRVIGLCSIDVDIKHDNRLFVKYFFSPQADIF